MSLWLPVQLTEELFAVVVPDEDIVAAKHFEVVPPLVVGVADGRHDRELRHLESISRNQFRPEIMDKT
jgi:hypothetical protein